MMKVKIVTPQGLYNTYEVEKIHCTTAEGECALLSNHMPMVAMLQISPLILTMNKEDMIFAISGGILHLAKNEVEILADSIEGQDEIDLARANAAKERALKRLERRDANTSIRRAEVSLQRAVNRINVKGL